MSKAFDAALEKEIEASEPDERTDQWRRELFLMLDHYVIAAKGAYVLNTTSRNFQKALESLIESAIAEGQPASNQHDHEDE